VEKITSLEHSSCVGLRELTAQTSHDELNRDAPQRCDTGFLPKALESRPYESLSTLLGIIPRHQMTNKMSSLYDGLPGTL
jgi:hypothetical protein